MKLSNMVYSIHARQILTSRGYPTVEVEFRTRGGIARSSVPSGLSIGGFEKPVGVDNGNTYNGRSVMMIVDKINRLADKILEAPIGSQYEFDRYIEALDEPDYRANFTLPLSICFSKAVAIDMGIPLEALIEKEIFGTNHIGKENRLKNNVSVGDVFNLNVTDDDITGNTFKSDKEFKNNYNRKEHNVENVFQPIPFFNVLNGGAHSGNGLWCQEIMVGFNEATISQNIELGCVVYEELRNIIIKEYGGIYTSVGDEGGFTPPIKSVEEGIELVIKACNNLNIKNYGIALDFAANSVYNKGIYEITTSNGIEYFTGQELCQYIMKLLDSYKVIYSIEDPFYEEDIKSWSKLYKMIIERGEVPRRWLPEDCINFSYRKQGIINIVADDLTVTNDARILAYSTLFDTLLIKPNQSGTLSGTYSAIKKARERGCKIKISHRSAETEDIFICHLAAGAKAEYIKFGAPCRGERIAKYNEMLRIFEQ
ncbi:enolase [Pancytospora epiphaga]|nr:enolase [Pancytospora epiphaga]